ncbi:hypothetical protein H0H92_010143 [Tricholoma furcatifolium]|nr:hypothetical protein H0H92_010143 [Tricholoma furcatifolium]
MSPTQKALLLESKQGKFVTGSRNIPKPGPGELLVKVHATGLNPVDWKIQKYGAFITEFPAVLGTDVAGEVEALGEGVTSFKKGDRVFAQGTFESDYASFQQYALTYAATTAKIPSKFSYEDVATIPVGLTAAYVGLYNVKPHGFGLAQWGGDPATQGKYAGKPIVILGGASSVGQYAELESELLMPALQLARLSGFSPIITTASLKHNDHLKSLGATHILDRNLSTEALKTEIKNLTDEPIDIVYDAISSAQTQQTGNDLLVPGGTLVTVLNLAITKSEHVDHVQVLGILRLPQNKDLLEGLYPKLETLLETGALVPNRFQVLSGGLEGIVGGLQKLENDQVSGVKLVARPWDA